MPAPGKPVMYLLFSETNVTEHARKNLTRSKSPLTVQAVMTFAEPDRTCIQGPLAAFLNYYGSITMRGEVVEDVLAQEVREFALRYLDSVAQLEALLLLRREPDTEWTVAKASRRLYIDEIATSLLLDSLHKRKLVKLEPATAGGERYVYGPATEELDRLVSITADAYARYLIPLTEMLHAKSTTAAHRFADAFRFREKKP